MFKVTIVQTSSLFVFISTNLICGLNISAASVAQWLARSAVNRKVGGSSPPGGANLFF